MTAPTSESRSFRSRFRKSLRDSLFLTLALNLSGALPVLHLAFADSVPVAEPSASALTDVASHLEENLNQLIARAKHPGFPGQAAGVPSGGELAQSEADLAKLRENVEAALTQSKLSSDAQLATVHLYLKELTLLTTLRICLNLSHGPSWSDAFALRVPNATTSLFVSNTELKRDRQGDSYTPLVIEHQGEHKGEHQGEPLDAQTARLKLSTGLVHGLELGHLADHPDDASHFTMLQSMALRQLMSNLLELKQLKRDHQVKIPEIPGTLREKLETVGLYRNMVEEQDHAARELMIRLGLIKAYDRIESNIPDLVDGAFATQLAQAMGETPKARQELVAPLQEALLKAEHDGMGFALQEEIAGSRGELAQLSGFGLMDVLADFISKSKTSAVLSKIMELQSNDTLDLSEAQRQSVLDILEARQKTLAVRLNGATLENWAIAAENAAQSAVYADTRLRFTETLLEHAPEVSEFLQRSYGGDVINPSLLLRAYAREFAELDPSPWTLSWLHEILCTGSFQAAREKYAQIIATEMRPTLVIGGIVDPRKAADFLRSADFTPKMTFARNVPQGLARETRKTIANGRREDLKNLVALADTMGFHRLYPSNSPSVREVIQDDAHAQIYFDKLAEITRSQNPILDIEVQAPDEDGHLNLTKLADALVAANPDLVNSAPVMKRIEPLIDQALIKVEANLLSEIEHVALARTPQDLEEIVTGSVMLSLVMSGFPEFHLQQDKFRQELLSPSLVDQLMRRYVNKYVEYGFGALMLFQVIKFSSKFIAKDALPYISIIGSGIDAVTAGYMRSAMIAVLADKTYMAAEAIQASRARDEIQKGYLCGATGPCLFSANELQSSQDKASHAWSTFGWSVAADTAFMFAPMGWALFNESKMAVTAEVFAQDSAAFAQLGLKPGSFDEIGKRVNLARRLRQDSKLVAHIIDLEPRLPIPHELPRVIKYIQKVAKLDSEQFAELLQSAERLQAKAAAGQAYQLPNILSELAREDAFRTLDLSPKPSSFSEIDNALENLSSRKYAHTREEIAVFQRAHDYLQDYLAVYPSAAKEPLKEITAVERRLIKALGRTRLVDTVWRTSVEMQLNAHGVQK
jgi:DNA-directed RNA polymerase subunit F